MMLTINLPKANFEGNFYYNLPGHPENGSFCYFRYYLGELPQAKQIIILTELKDNPGASITNCAEYIPEQLKYFLKEKYNIELAENAIFIEHYEANHYGDGEEERFALFNTKGQFQHLSTDRLKLIFDEYYITNWSAIALLQSWNEEDEEYEEDELDITYSLRGSPFVDPILDTWTIYKDIEGFPNKFVAVRRIGENAHLDKKSDLIIKDSIDEIRDIMEQEKRIRREAVHNEEDRIIEMWI